MLEASEGKQKASNYERVIGYLIDHPAATDQEIANTLVISHSTVNKWRKRLKVTSGLIRYDE